MLGIEDLKNFLEENSIQAEIIEFEKPVITSKDVLKLLGNVKVVKSILIITEKFPIVCILPGNRKIDFEKIKKLFEVKEVRLAKAKEVKEITGYDIGALPPFAHKQKIKTIVDKSLENIKEDVYCGGGSHYSLLKINPKILIEMFEVKDFSC
ncbi:MAG: hypothetical protein B6U78_00035 [Candidatus Aenigmarchaeota archaeon ex4484_224]|nr:MAG: hypothetical protein B6U78_00035 [Candidatus Aenigmarchaeota archaeon ex4484_224]